MLHNSPPLSSALHLCSLLYITACTTALTVQGGMLIIAGQLGEQPSPKNMTPTSINTLGDSYIADPASSVHYNTGIVMHNSLQHTYMSAGDIATTFSSQVSQCTWYRYHLQQECILRSVYRPLLFHIIQSMNTNQHKTYWIQNVMQQVINGRGYVIN